MCRHTPPNLLLQRITDGLGNRIISTPNPTATPTSGVCNRLQGMDSLLSHPDRHVCGRGGPRRSSTTTLGNAMSPWVTHQPNDCLFQTWNLATNTTRVMYCPVTRQCAISV